MCKFGISGNQNYPNLSRYPVTYFLCCHSKYLYVLYNVKCKVQTSTQLGRNLSWKMGGHCSKLFVTIRVTQLGSASGFGLRISSGRKLLDCWKNSVGGKCRRCGCGKQCWPQRKVTGWLPEFYCSEVMVHFLTSCFALWLHVPIKDQVFGYLLPEFCLYSVVSVLQGNVFK